MSVVLERHRGGWEMVDDDEYLSDLEDLVAILLATTAMSVMDNLDAGDDFETGVEVVIESMPTNLQSTAYSAWIDRDKGLV